MHSLYYRSMGKFFRVIAICKSDEEANQYLEKYNREEIGVIGVIGSHPVIAEFNEGKITICNRGSIGSAPSHPKRREK